MNFECLNCGHRWVSRIATTPRQCPSCWSTAIVDEDTLRRGALIARFLANWQRGQGPLPALANAIAAFMPNLPPLLPLPRFLPSLWAWNDVMAQAKTKDMKVQAISRMLEVAGFPPEDARGIAQELAK